jgi:tRNA uridine 5-carbamoylmethylation protein Kti12
MASFTMLVGLPGVGKSTYIKNKLLPHMDQNKTIVLSTDDYIQKFAHENNKTYNEVFAEHFPLALKQMNKDFDCAISNNNNIILDQTNLSIKSRHKKLCRVPKTYYKRCVIIFPVSDFVHHKYLHERNGKTIPEHDMKKMRESFQLPSRDEGFDVISYHVNIYMD